MLHVDIWLTFWNLIMFQQVAPYCASKWAVEGLSRSVAKELPSGLAIVALNPGVINTDMLMSCFGGSAALYQTPEAWYHPFFFFSLQYMFQHLFIPVLFTVYQYSIETRFHAYISNERKTWWHWARIYMIPSKKMHQNWPILVLRNLRRNLLENLGQIWSMISEWTDL